MEEAAADVRARVLASFERQGLMTHLEVFAVAGDHRTLIAAGQQTLIQIEARPER